MGSKQWLVHTYNNDNENNNGNEDNNGNDINNGNDNNNDNTNQHEHRERQVCLQKFQVNDLNLRNSFELLVLVEFLTLKNNCNK